jgi:hypothetical protein
LQSIIMPSMHLGHKLHCPASHGSDVRLTGLILVILR